MKIRFLKLRNFQRHRDLTIEFSPTITTIRGRSDKGKSSILRALRWICLNDFRSDFISFGEDRCRVSMLVIKDGKRITINRGRGPGEFNVYRMQGEVYKSFGTSVPIPIAKTLHLGEFNFQGQHDPVLWFSNTGGQVSRDLNAILDLHAIDEILGDVASRLKDAKKELDLHEKELGERSEEFDSLLDQRKNALECRRLLESIESKQSDFAELDKNSRDLEGILEEYDRCKTTPPPDFRPIKNLFHELKEEQENFNGLSDLLESFWETSKLLGDYSSDLYAAKKKFAAKTKNQNCPLCKKPL